MIKHKIPSVVLNKLFIASLILFCCKISAQNTYRCPDSLGHKSIEEFREYLNDYSCDNSCFLSALEYQIERGMVKILMSDQKFDEDSMIMDIYMNWFRYIDSLENKKIRESSMLVLCQIALEGNIINSKVDDYCANMENKSLTDLQKNLLIRSRFALAMAEKKVSLGECYEASAYLWEITSYYRQLSMAKGLTYNRYMWIYTNAANLIGQCEGFTEKVRKRYNLWPYHVTKLFQN